MSEAKKVKLSRRGVERWTNAHPWIYQSDVEAPKVLMGGEVVQVIDHRNFFLGQAFFSRESKISLRWLTWEDRPIDEAFFKQRIEAADQLRRDAYPGETTYRVVHGEADGIPGLVVDRFGDYLSVQFLIPGTEQRKEVIADLLVAHFKCKGIVNRSDVNVRTLEGLALEKGIMRGDVPPSVTYNEGSIELRADLLNGQKTGAFLDQRENHVVAGNYSSGEALDCFAYHGGFALQLARKAKRVTAVEISEPACGQIVVAAKLNDLSNIDVVSANAFDFLRDMVDEGKKYDTIVLDPPSFAKNKNAIEAAIRGYKEINLRAMQLLNPGGYLITASCTYHVPEAEFEAMLDSAAADAKRRIQIVEKRGAGKDHPVLLGLRETRYLKCFVLRAT